MMHEGMGFVEKKEMIRQQQVLERQPDAEEDILVKKEQEHVVGKPERDDEDEEDQDKRDEDEEEEEEEGDVNNDDDDDDEYEGSLGTSGEDSGEEESGKRGRSTSTNIMNQQPLFKSSSNNNNTSGGKSKRKKDITIKRQRTATVESVTNEFRDFGNNDGVSDENEYSRANMMKIDENGVRVEFVDPEEWKTSYIRTRHKNLRCFPRCCARHMENGFCGQSIMVYVYTESPELKREQGLYLCGLIRKVDGPHLYKVGQEADTKVESFNQNEVVIGEWKHYDAVHKRWLVEVAPPRRWRYIVKLAKHLSGLKHVFTAYVCSAVLRKCVQVGDSPAFKLTSAWKQPSSTSHHNHSEGESPKLKALRASRSTSPTTTLDTTDGGSAMPSAASPMLSPLANKPIVRSRSLPNLSSSLLNRPPPLTNMEYNNAYAPGQPQLSSMIATQQERISKLLAQINNQNFLNMASGQPFPMPLLQQQQQHQHMNPGASQPLNSPLDASLLSILARASLSPSNNRTTSTSSSSLLFSAFENTQQSDKQSKNNDQ